jgi:hypothetical protein
LVEACRGVRHRTPRQNPAPRSRFQSRGIIGNVSKNMPDIPDRPANSQSNDVQKLLTKFLCRVISVLNRH